MFNFNSSSSVTPSQRSDDFALVLKLNQRVTAEVLQVNGNNVILAIEGMRVVARLRQMTRLPLYKNAAMPYSSSVILHLTRS